MNPPPTVLFQPLNHIGLGHMNRLSVIALALKDIDANVRTPFVIEGSSHLLLDALGLPYIPLPDSHSMSAGRWVDWSDRERSSLQSCMSRSILESIAPQIVVFDCLPSPTFAEAVIDCEIPIVLCIREMRELHRYLEEVSGLLEHVDRIIIPHAPGTFNLPGRLSSIACCVGQIARSIRNRSKVQNLQGRRVLIAGGGGGYPGTVEFYNLAVQSIAELRRHCHSIKGHLVTGPLFSDWHRLRLKEGITLSPFEPDWPSKGAESDLVICQAGYNTVAELELLGTKAVLVPAEREWDDQFARAEHVSRRCQRFRTFTGTKSSELSQIASDLLSEDIPDCAAPLADGAAKAARLIYALVPESVRAGAANCGVGK